MKSKTHTHLESSGMAIVVITLAVVSIITFAVGMTMLSIWYDNMREQERLEKVAEDMVPYRAEVVEGTCKDLGIESKDIMYVQCIGGTLYIVTTDVNAYLVGINIENGAVTYVDVEEELIK